MIDAPPKAQMALFATAADEYDYYQTVRSVGTFPPNGALDCPPPKPDFVEDVRIHGVIEPVEVAKLNDGREVILSGRRRIWASRLAGREHIRCLVYVGVPPEVATRWARSLQNRDDNPLTDITAVREAVAAGKTERQIRSEFSLTPQELKRLLRLSTLPEPFLNALREGRMAPSTLDAVARLPETAHAGLLYILDHEGRLVASHVAAAKTLIEPPPAPASLPGMESVPATSVSPAPEKFYLVAHPETPLFAAMAQAQEFLALVPGGKILEVAAVAGG